MTSQDVQEKSFIVALTSLYVTLLEIFGKHYNDIKNIASHYDKSVSIKFIDKYYS